MNSATPGCVAEILGIDGPVLFPELLMQKIWASAEFSHEGMVTTTGESVEIIGTGRWNRLAGPDFVGARLRLGGRERRGDIELHLRAEDWAAHGHAGDPGFANVVLHVVLFPPNEGFVCVGAGGAGVPTLVLLPLLPRDLESFALDDAAERLANRSLFHAREELGLLAHEALLDDLRRRASKRWDAKVSFARLRLTRMNWRQACHSGALECLGYRFNRAAMASIAERWPLEDWSSGRAVADRIWETTRDLWKTPWGRPSNHPLQRLRSYERWARAIPNWPERLAEAFPVQVMPTEERTDLARRSCGMARLRRQLSAEVAGEVLTGPRFNTLICDQWLPLLAAASGSPSGWLVWWFIWYPGDLPTQHARCLKEMGVTRGKTQLLCNGWTQGLLGWCIDRETDCLLSNGSERSDS